MKNYICLFIIFIMLFSMIAIPISAGTVPTAKIKASLVGDDIPVAGEKFTIAISIEDISSGLFASGEVKLNWSSDVVSLADYYEDEPVVVTNDYCIGNIYNEYAGRTGKFTYVSNFDRSTSGTAAVAIYIPIAARSQSSEAVTDFSMFEISFILNNGYSYNDFYLALSGAVCFLTEDKKVASCEKNGDISCEGIGINVNSESAVLTDEYYVTGSLLNEVKTAVLLNESVLSNESSGNDLNATVNILYNDEYNETVLKNDSELTVSISITNSGTSNKECSCYIVEYNADGCMIGMTRNNTIIVAAGETVTAEVSKSVLNSTTVTAKILLWENGVLIPVKNNIVLSPVPTDYYADTYETSTSVEINKKICGTINIADDVDIVKINTTDEGGYVIRFSANNPANYSLYDSAGNVITATTVDEDYALYSLSGNSVYYLKMTGNEDCQYHIKPMSAEVVEKNIGTEDVLSDVYDCEMYKFVPQTTGEYIITAIGTEGVCATLYNASFEKLASSNTADDDVSFRIAYEMTANETYYIVVEQKNDEIEATPYELYVEEPFEIVSIQ